MKKFNTRQIVSKYNFKFSKKLGQNFLTDDTVLDLSLYTSDAADEEDSGDSGGRRYI